MSLKMAKQLAHQNGLDSAGDRMVVATLEGDGQAYDLCLVGGAAPHFEVLGDQGGAIGATFFEFEGDAMVVLRVHLRSAGIVVPAEQAGHVG